MADHCLVPDRPWVETSPLSAARPVACSRGKTGRVSRTGEIEFYRLDTGERLLTAEERAANARQAEADARHAAEANQQALEAEIARLKAEIARRPLA